MKYKSKQTSILSKDYTFNKSLGKGAYGEVSLYTRNSDNKEFAIKRQDFQRFYRGNLSELDILVRLKHPNIIHLESFFIEGDNIYFILPYGEDAKAAINNGYRGNELTCFQLLDALDFLHKNGYYHCDIKPENILLFNYDDENQDVLLSDLGLAKSIKMPPIPCTTPKYAPPEFLKKYRNQFDPENQIYIDQPQNGLIADIWCLGITLVYFLVGRYLFQIPGFTQTQTMNYFINNPQNRLTYLSQFGIPVQYMPLLMGMLEPDIRKRFTTQRCLIEPIFTDFEFVEGSAILNRGPISPINYPIKIQDNIYEPMSLIQTLFRGNCDYLKSNAFSFITSLDLLYRIITPEDDFLLFFYTCLMLSCYYVNQLLNGDHFRKLILKEYKLPEINRTVQTIIERIGGAIGTLTLYDYSFSIKTLQLSWESMISGNYSQIDLQKFYKDILMRYKYQPGKLSLSEKYLVSCEQIDTPIDKHIPLIIYNQQETPIDTKRQSPPQPTEPIVDQEEITTLKRPRTSISSSSSGKPSPKRSKNSKSPK